MELFILLPLIVFFIWLVTRQTGSCPDCNERLPRFQSPTTKINRQRWVGGATCSNCGCECTAEGIKASDAAAVSAATKFSLVALVVIAGVPAIVMLAYLTLGS